MVETLMSVVMLLIQLFLGIVLGILSVYLAIRFFDRMTEGIDEFAELKKGNVAVAIVLLALIAGIGTIVSTGTIQFGKYFASGLSLPMFFVTFVMLLVQILVVVLIAVLSIYISIRIIDTLTVGIDELKEIKRGNVAVAIEIAAVIYVVSLIVASSITGIENLSVFKPETLGALLGVA